MLFVMRNTFMNKRLNSALVVSFVLLFIVALWMGRQQLFLGND